MDYTLPVEPCDGLERLRARALDEDAPLLGRNLASPVEKTALLRL
jgi:hypothetical protein